LLLGCQTRMGWLTQDRTAGASVTGHTSIVEFLIQEQPGQKQDAGGEAQTGYGKKGLHY
ncbi:Protein fem-1 A, partial [Saguinus oedipus]